MPENDQNPPADPIDPPPPPSSGWSQRRGKKRFWLLLFAPAVLCLIALAILANANASGPEALGLVVIPALAICAYCGYWLAAGFKISTTGKVFATIGLTLGFVLLNGIVFFAGCLAFLMVAAP